ncbi:MAG: hypothetical protein AAFO01_19495 [Pseudomonadota bacterium]
MVPVADVRKIVILLTTPASACVHLWRFPVMQLPAEMRPEVVIPHDFLPEWRLSGA